MLKSEYRLKKRKEFNYLYKFGTVSSTKLLLLYYIPAKRKVCKIGITVSNKIGKAHIRNKIKRQLRVILSELVSKMKQNYTYNFVVRENFDKITFTKQKEFVILVLKNANLLG